MIKSELVVMTLIFVGISYIYNDQLKNDSNEIEFLRKSRSSAIIQAKECSANISLLTDYKSKYEKLKNDSDTDKLITQGLQAQLSNFNAEKEKLEEKIKLYQREVGYLKRKIRKMSYNTGEM